MRGCDIDGCGEPVLAEGVCYDHAKACSRCDGPSRNGECEDLDRCSEQLRHKNEEDATARGNEYVP